MICPDCKVENPDEANFCGYCGKKLQDVCNNCWVWEEPHNCEQEECPGTWLLVQKVRYMKQDADKFTCETWR